MGTRAMRRVANGVGIVAYLLATVFNVINWRVVPCEWDRPYRK